MTAIHIQRRSIFAAVAARWAAIYTLGLPESARERRLLQVESDIWEQEADGMAEGIAPARVGFDIFERAVRGIPADILWRFQLEGPKVQFKIPFERVTGMLLLLLILLVPISTSISGFDTGRAGWEGELQHIGERPDYQIAINVVLWLTCGIVLIAMAAGFYHALQRTASLLSTFAAFALAAAGVLVLAATAVYKSMTDLAGQYTGAATEESLVTTSWALVLTMEMLQGAVVLTLSLGIFSLAMAAHRHRLVAGWLGYVAALSAALLIVAGIVDVFAETDVTWTLLMGGLLLLMLWLVVAGFTLVINRKPPVDPSIAPITTPA